MCHTITFHPMLTVWDGWFKKPYLACVNLIGIWACIPVVH